MELTFKRPIEELIPALIEWNNEELLTEVRRLMKAYDGKVYVGEDAARAMKEDRAKINKFVKALTESRMSVKRVYEAPYLKFKAQVDEVVREADRVAEQIDFQIKEREIEEKNRKYEELKAYWEGCAAELLAVVPYEKIHRDKWLNTTVSLRNAEMEMNDRITEIRKNRMTIGEMKALTEGERERVLTYYFRTLDLGNALRENEAYREEKRRLETLKTMPPKEEVKEEKQEEKNATREPVVTNTETVKRFRISFTVTGTAQEIAALSGFLKEHKYSYQKI